MQTELKPCPFCGGEAGIYQDYCGFYTVQCDKCGIGTLHKCDESEVINDWNRRAKDEPMTIDRVCKEFGISDIGEFSDGYHTFNSLYHQRAVLFATIVNQNKDRGWKSRKHSDGESCFGGGWFIVGVDTPEGSYTYHYKDKYWDLFKCVELPCSKPWDGHTEEDVTRLLSLEDKNEIS